MATRLNIQAIKQEYLLTRQLDGLSPKTIQLYELVIRQFLDHLDDEEITSHTVRAFLFEASETRKETTVNIYCRTLRTFCHWLVEAGYADTDPMANIRTPKVATKFPKTLTDEEVVALIKAAKPNPRNHAIILLMVDSAVRASELTGLKTDDIDLLTRSMRVFGKGRKERVVFFSIPTGKALAKYLAFRPDVLHEDALFLNRQRTPLTQSGLARGIAILAEKAGIKRKVTPHCLRHTSATMYVKNGGDSHSLQHLLGHSTLTMAQRYVDLVGRDLAEAHQRYSLVMRLESQRR